VLIETYTIQCVPETARVERLLVRLSQARDEPVQWSLAGASSGEFSARRTSAAEQAQLGLAPGGEAWELSVNVARPGAFELRGVRSVPLREALPLALAAVADAASQRGTLTIRVLGSTGVSIKNRRLASIPAELLEADRYQTARATYHFQPGRDDLGADPAVSVAPAAVSQASGGAWAWTGSLHSRYAFAGTADHWATLRIQTAGKQRVRVNLPQAARLQAAWVDDQRLPLVLSAADEGGILVDLPGGRKFATLSLHYATTAGLPQLAASREAPFPTLDIPVVAREWKVWLPPGFEILEAPRGCAIESMEPVTLTERFFGRLGRDATSRTFNPLTARDWQQLFSRGSDVRLARDLGKRFVETLGTAMTEFLAGEAESELTWGQLLARAADTRGQSEPAVLIDVPSLASLRLSPLARVRFHPGDSALARGVALLQDARLAVLARADAVVIVSATTAAAESRQLATSDQNVVFTISPGPLFDEVDRALDPRNGSRYQGIASWRAAPEVAPPPWTQPANAGIQDAAAWNAYTLHLSDAGAPRIRIVRTAAMSSLAWAIFMAVVALGIWQARRWPAAIVLVAALAGAMTLLLPPAYAAPASAAFLGALVCLALRMTRLPPRARAPARSPAHSSRAKLELARQASLLLLIAAGWNVGSLLFASQPNVTTTAPAVAAGDDSGPQRKSPNEAPQAAGAAQAPGAQLPATPIQRVFVPVDDQQRPAGEKYFVPQKLYQQLDRLAAAASGKPKGWLITRATYQGVVARDPASKQLGLTQLKASLDLHVLQANVAIQLPFPREGMADPLVGARLDGRPITLTWNATRDALTLPALPAEHYRLQLDLHAPPQTYASGAGFDLAIPPLAGAELELSIPPDAPAIELPSAHGQTRLQKDPGRLHAQLGACNRLSVRWPVGIGMEASAANLEVEELIWVKVRPGTTVFDTKFKYRVVEGSVRQIRLLADPRLRLLPSTSAQSPIAAVRTTPGDPQKIDLELSRTVSDQVVIELSFLLTGTSGVGNLQFPRLESSAIRATRRWLSVSVDPALESKELPGEDSRPIAIADFMTAWGGADARPQAAYSIPRGEAMWVLATQPSEPRTSVEQILTASIGRGSALIELDAALTIQGGYLFQLGLQAAPRLAIERVSVLDDNVERASRWSTDPAGRITVFLTGPITGRHRLTLRGRVESPTSDAVAVPQLALIGAETSRNRWHVYRQNAVLVEVDAGPGVTEYQPDEDEPRDDLGAWVGGYETNDPRAGIAWRVTPNSPQSEAVALTTLARDGDRWMAQMDCRVTVLDGVVDALTFDIPPQWAEPFHVDPPVQTKVMLIPGETRRQLIVYPDRPIADKYEVKIQGRVALSAGDRLRVPDIVPQHMRELVRFVLLPQRLDLQQITWETVGLARAKLPLEWAQQRPSAASAAVYQVEGEHFAATLRGVQRANAVARVALADIHVAWQPDGHYQALAAFDVEPAGATSCVLELPANCKLLHASIESIPAQLAPLEHNRWRLGLGPPQLPQRLELVYTGALADSTDGQRFESPRLVDLEVEETLWTVYGPRPFEIGPSHGASTGPIEQELHRLKSVARLLQLPAEIVGEQLPEEIARWYRPWRKRYFAYRTELSRELAAIGQTSAQSAEAIEAARLDAKVSAVDERLASPALDPRNLSQFDAAAELLPAIPSPARTVRLIANGRLYSLEFSGLQAASAGWIARFAVAIAMLACGIAAAYFLRARELPKFAPWVAITAIGVTWWLCLAPSIIGLVVLVAGAWTALREQLDRRAAAS
jgi:hypothetical protein